MKKYILALDEGTTSARAILFDRSGHTVAMARHEFPQIYPRAGWVEQDPMAIYAAQYASMTECLAGSGIDPAEIAAVGLTNQRETVVVWDKHTGKPLCNAIVWQCRRTADICAKLEADGYADLIRQRTGLRLDPYFSGTKLAWILDHVEGAREKAEAGELLFGTVDTWITWKLTEGRVFVTDVTNASRTMLYDSHKLDWDDTLLRWLDIPRAMLPEVRSSSEIYGTAAMIDGVVEHSIIFRGVKVGKGSVVRNSIVLQDTVIGANVTINCVITDKNVIINEGRTLSGHETLPFFIAKGTRV